MDLLRVKQSVHPTLLNLLAEGAALEGFCRTHGRLSQRNRSVDSSVAPAALAFALYCAKLRRTIAPAAALTRMSAPAGRCRTPKSTANSTAPAAAANVNNHVGAGGTSEIAAA